MAVCRATIFGRIFGQMTNNVIHFHKADYVTSDLANLSYHIQNNFCYNPFALNLDGHFKYERLYLDMQGASSDYLDVSMSLGGVGGPSTNGLPFVAACFQLRTAVAGRRGRGRWFQAGFGQHQYNAGQWDSSAMTTLNACATQLKNVWLTPSGGAYTATGWHMVLCPRDDDTAWISLTDIVARPMVARVGRRQLGSGS